MKDETEKILDVIESMDSGTETDASEAMEAAEFAQAAAEAAMAMAEEALEQSNVKVDTKENWDAQTTLIAEENIVYVYSNQYTVDGASIPGFKIGDGTSYLIDMPFNDDIMARHIADTNIHVTLEEKECWNNKVTCFIDANDLENLVFTKNCI